MKIITEAELQQAIDALDKGNWHEQRRARDLLRAVMEREGPLEMNLYSPKTKTYEDATFTRDAGPSEFGGRKTRRDP